MPNCWCGPTCGERYWGDFYSDAPDCRDPCDTYGNYSGGGCRNCGGPSGHTHGHHNGYADDGAPMTQEDEITPQAEHVMTPAHKPTLAPPRKTIKPQPDSP